MLCSRLGVPCLTPRLEVSEPESKEPSDVPQQHEGFDDGEPAPRYANWTIDGGTYEHCDFLAPLAVQHSMICASISALSKTRVRS